MRVVAEAAEVVGAVVAVEIGTKEGKIKIWLIMKLARRLPEKEEIETERSKK